MNKFNLFILCFPILYLLHADLLFSQTGLEVTQEDLTDMISRNTVPVIKSTETNGSPYFFDSFKDGKITLTNERVTETLPMNYNIHENHLEIASGNSALVIEADKIKGFQFQDGPDAFVFTKGYDSRNLAPEEFVLKLTGGNGGITPLVKFQTSFHENVATYGSATQKDEYVTKTTFYLHKDGETEHIRRLRERIILRSLDSHRDQMQDFIRDNNLDIKELNDFKTFFEHYNQLVKP